MYVVSSPQGGSNEILYTKESPHNQKKNETEVTFLQADKIKRSLRRTSLIIVTLLLIFRDSMNFLMRKVLLLSILFCGEQEKFNRAWEGSSRDQAPWFSGPDCIRKIHKCISKYKGKMDNLQSMLDIWGFFY